jgi:hypothetical protein
VEGTLLGRDVSGRIGEDTPTSGERGRDEKRDRMALTRERVALAPP